MLGLECTQQLFSKGARLHLELVAKFGSIIPILLASSCERWKSGEVMETQIPRTQSLKVYCMKLQR